MAATISAARAQADRVALDRAGGTGERAEVGGGLGAVPGHRARSPTVATTPASGQQRQSDAEHPQRGGAPVTVRTAPPVRRDLPSARFRRFAGTSPSGRFGRASPATPGGGAVRLHGRPLFPAHGVPGSTAATAVASTVIASNNPNGRTCADTVARTRSPSTDTDTAPHPAPPPGPRPHRSRPGPRSEHPRGRPTRTAS